MNSRQFAVIAAITFFVGMVWLVADIIFNTKPSIPISPKLETLLEPVTPTFNQRVLDVINEETVSTDDVPINTAPIIVSPVPSAQPSPVVASPLPEAGEGEGNENL